MSKNRPVPKDPENPTIAELREQFEYFMNLQVTTYTSSSPVYWGLRNVYQQLEAITSNAKATWESWGEDCAE